MDEVGKLYRELFDSVKLHMNSRRAKYLALQKDFFESSIVNLTNDLSAFDGSMYDFRSVLEPSSQRAERTATRLAWLCQHAFDARAVSVNEKPIRATKKGTLFPLLKQASCCGYDYLKPQIVRYKQLASQANSKLHVMLHNRSRNEFILVQGVSFKKAGSLNKNCFDRRSDAPLFSDRKVYGNVFAPPSDVNSVLLARDMMRQCVPSAHVKAFIVIIDDERYDQASDSYIASSRFQSHEVTNAKYPAGGSSRYCLDALPTGPSVIDFQSELLADPDYFYKLPCKNWQWLQFAPASRPTRCVMMLDSMVSTQLASNRLIEFTHQQTLNRVEGEYGIYYPKDLHRHDVEQGLLPNEFIEKRIVRGHPRYVVAPAGIALIHNIRRNFDESYKLSTNEIVHSVIQHEDYFVNS